MPKFLENKCSFQTVRLNVLSYFNYIKNHANGIPLADQVTSIMTPKVTESLPSGWKNINTVTNANNWLNKISKESSFLLVQLKNTEEIMGFIFLYESADIKTPMDIRLGYLLSENFWGLGMGSELIKGLLSWCNSSAKIHSITGGVEPDNIGSIKVLMKNGFVQTDSNIDGTLFYVYDFCQN